MPEGCSPLCPRTEGGALLAAYVTWLVDDDPIQLAGIAAMLAQSRHADRLTVVPIAGSRELLARLADMDETAPDIVLMDMDLGDGLPHGADLVSRNAVLKKAQIVYVTAYLELVPEAYRTEHRYTLAKPIKASELDSALERAMAGIKQADECVLTFSCGAEVVCIPCTRVRWIESRGHRVAVFTEKGQLSTNEPLRDICSRLPRCFVRTHKSFVVNLDQAFSLRANDLMMADGSFVPVSRTYRKDVKEKLMARLAES